MAEALKALPIAAYLDRLSARPGERIEVRVSVARPGRCRARLERLICGDANPAGPGMQFENLSAVFDHAFDGRAQEIGLGSWGEATGPALGAGPHTWAALIWPTLADERAVLCHAGDAARLTLSLTPQGVAARLECGGQILETRTDVPAPLRRWSRVWASLDPATGRLGVGLAAPCYQYQPALEAFAEASGEVVIPSRGTISFARGALAAPSFTGKIEDPAVLTAFRDTWPEPLATLRELGPEAAWDFSQGIRTQDLAPVGPKARAGTLFNLPTRAVKGARWENADAGWPQAPAGYGAIKFHDDDLGDCGWVTDFVFEVPRGLKSGAYGLRLTCGDGEDWVPFYVLPERRAKAHPRLVFLAPTFTYQAYGNHAREATDDAFRRKIRAWGAYPHNADDWPLYGRATYNHHADGAGIAYSSRLRPLLTMRPGYITFDEKAGSGLRHYPADSHILAWLEAKAIAFDVVTDEDLDGEGADLISPYRLVLTGTHPEYHTSRTLDALQAHVRGGGRLAYLGGNGFYWRIARNLAGWALEVRRAESGVRTWAAEPGEYHHAFDGGLGGLWLRNGRPPQQLVGVGFSSQGPYAAGCFRRTGASRDPALAWMFDGVEADILGDNGLCAGGAAGFELDRADKALGTPASAVVVARSEGVPAGFSPVPEDLESADYALSGEPLDSLVRADMTFFETDGGGAVFSAAAITFCGSLWNGTAFDGPLSRLLENVVGRLSA
ncbi:MAG TPA: N,N-dimethylformamidase beta subunit family domain-containing protein [Caulobacteraceae bacterium]|nr:N,N-dimethylformamidase beta subunit family domain-containing protein [Caulobacteraceae bacterium]